MWNHSTLSVGSETGMILHSKWALWPSLTSMVFMEEVKTGAWVVCSSYEMIMQKVRFIDLEQKRWKKGSTITKSETYSQIIILQLCFTQYSNFFIIRTTCLCPSISYYFHIPKFFLNFFPHSGKNWNRRNSNLLP